MADLGSRRGFHPHSRRRPSWRARTSTQNSTAAGKLTLKDIDAEIARLQQQAALIRDAEKAEVIGRIKEAIAYYGITADELGFDAKPRKLRAPAAPPAKGKAPATESATEPKPTTKGRIKYQDVAGSTWSGFGPKPKWFVQALAEGKTVADLIA